jgi:transposase
VCLQTSSMEAMAVNTAGLGEPRRGDISHRYQDRDFAIRTQWPRSNLIMSKCRQRDRAGISKIAQPCLGDPMRRIVEGVDRSQTTLFAESLDDWVDENNPVRVIEALRRCARSAGAGLGGVVPGTQPERSKTLHRGFRVIRLGQDPVGRMNSGQEA